MSGSIWTNRWESIAYWQESEQREVTASKLRGVTNDFALSQMQFGILVLVTMLEKFCVFPLF